MLVTLRVLRLNKVKLVRQISILGFFSLTGIEYLFSCEIWLQLWFSCFSLRSPWSNSYDPPLDDGAVPSLPGPGLLRGSAADGTVVAVAAAEAHALRLHGDLRGRAQG